MPRVLIESQQDPDMDAVEASLMQEEERILTTWQERSESSADLSDGGIVNGVRLTPTQDGIPQEKGRPAARRAWMWNGTETLLPLAWQPGGKSHDGARRYLLKRHCLCCKNAGFRGACPRCVKASCQKCNGGRKKEFNIPCFYLRKEDVPYPMRFYGPIDCFLPTCPRREGRGFKTDQDMRMHAVTRHGMEYQVHLQSIEASSANEVAELRRRLDTLMDSRQQAVPTAPAVQADAWQEFIEWKKAEDKREKNRQKMAARRQAKREQALQEKGPVTIQ